MVIKLDLKTKNSRSLISFLNIFSEFILKYDANCLVYQNNKKTKKTLFSILKSPHVNKSAQEQFEYKIYNKELTIFTYNQLIILIFLKIYNTKFFSDIKIKISCNLFVGNTDYNLHKCYLQNINSTYLRLMDIYGKKF